MKIPIKGVIIPSEDQWIYDLFDIEATSPIKVSTLIEQANGEELEVEINSPGGYVDQGSEIYTALKSYKGSVVVNIVGMAASSASIIAMAGNPTRMSPTATLMIHNCSMGAFGDHNDMDHASVVLKQGNASIANAYRLKTGLEEAEILEMMNEETYMTAQDAKEKGFVDEILFDNAGILRPTASALTASLIPREVINGLRQNKGSIQQQPKQNQAANQPEKTKNTSGEGAKVMDLETLRNEHPELYNQIVEEARKNAVETERARVNELQDLAETPGAKEIVEKHIKNGGSASEAAIEFMKSSKERLDHVKTNRDKDGAQSGAAEVPAAPTDTVENKSNREQETVDNRMSSAAETVNQNRINKNKAGGRV